MHAEACMLSPMISPEIKFHVMQCHVQCYYLVGLTLPFRQTPCNAFSMLVSPRSMGRTLQWQPPYSHETNSQVQLMPPCSHMGQFPENDSLMVLVMGLLINPCPRTYR